MEDNPLSEYTNDGPEHHDDALAMDMVDFSDDMGVDLSDFDHVSHGNQVDTDKTLLDPVQLTPTLSRTPVTPIPSTTTTDSGLSMAQPSSTGVNLDHMFQAETGMDEDDEDEDVPRAKKGKPNHPDVPGGFTLVDGSSDRRKIRIEYIGDKSRRHITFSKRKAGIMKKAYELSTLTGTQVLLLVVSETGLVYTFTTAKLQPLVTKAEGKELIQACLNAEDGMPPGSAAGTGTAGNSPDSAAGKGKLGNSALAIRPHKLTPAATANLAATATAHAGGGEDHPQSQAESQSSLGQGTPNNRPKKRMPSGRRKASSATVPTVSEHEVLPPVPQIPDIHRQASPHFQQITSPLSAGFHIQQDFQQHQQHQQQQHQQHQQPPSPYGYPTTPTHDYTQYYQQQHPHYGMGLHPQQQPQQQLQQQQHQQHPHQIQVHDVQFLREQEQARLLMERQRGNVGINM